MAPVGAQEPMHQHSCGRVPDVARNGACAAQAVIRLRHDGWPPMTWGIGSRERQLRRQYSSASMIVMTRRVTAGSDGSGEW
jgi:hypothetical protein